MPTRNEIIDMMRTLGPNTGMPTLQGLFPGVARGAIWDLLCRFRELCTRERNRLLHALRWKKPGTVWAMDHSEPPSPIDGKYEHALAVRDLASGYQLAWLPVEHEDAETTIKALKALFIEHGVPVVIKSDNGSAFVAEDTGDFLTREQVEMLLSPPRTPRYNGACEAGIGSMKTRTHHHAALNDRPGEWTCDDLEAGRRQANETARPWGWKAPTPEAAWRDREPISEEDRTTFKGAVCRWERMLGIHRPSESGKPLTKSESAAIRRRAMACALTAQGYLQVRRGRFSLPISG